MILLLFNVIQGSTIERNLAYFFYVLDLNVMYTMAIRIEATENSFVVPRYCCVVCSDTESLQEKSKSFSFSSKGKKNHEKNWIFKEKSQSSIYVIIALTATNIQFFVQIFM